MTAEEFNEKYRDYCEAGFEDYGPLEFDIPVVTKNLDVLFANCLVHVPGFNVAQIKLKFGKARFYSSLSHEMETMIEKMIDQIIEDNESK
jgi:hypothetical protein